MKVELGVIDMPYDYGEEPGKTTHQVAVDLEEQYKLFTHFYEQHIDDILLAVSDEIRLGLINHIKYGAPFDQETIILGEIVRSFNIFLEREEMAGLGVDGVPTWSALHGVNSRLKKETGPRRPSFIDGGLFKASFIAWISNNGET
ncbi:hypothetical protein [Serratia fonticola]|uniref:hypothetical protein n=1 Tax=Serratia fonticola TaxID=47917 RepID=UPI000BFE56E5|nr:hypothetical protein [Serratia fonticola]ATM78784.1 hypothetical protein CRN79_24435 [Serratia fonticola]NBJ34714.1 hypothetical protein [Serratia fonticola]